MVSGAKSIGELIRGGNNIQDLNDACLSYLKVRIDAKQNPVGADQARKLRHDRVIDELNIYVRNNETVDFELRQLALEGRRKLIGAWAIRHAAQLLIEAG